MTTTVCFQGKDGKNSSKVLAPPGGKSNISLFGSPDEPAPAPVQSPKQQPPASQAPFATQAKAQDYGPARSCKRVSNFNPVTGEPYATSPAAPAQPSQQPQPQASNSSPAQQQQQQPPQPSPQKSPAQSSGGEQAKTSVKIYNPPGGKSSISF